MRKNKTRNLLWILFIGIFAVLYLPSFFKISNTTQQKITYFQMTQVIKADAKKQEPMTLIENQNGVLYLSVKNQYFVSQTTPPQGEQGNNSVASLTQKYNINYRYINSGSLLSNIFSILSFLSLLIPILIIYYIFRGQRNGKMFSLPSSQSSTPTRIPDLTFSDIGGLSDEVFSECQQVINVFRNKRLSHRFGVQPAKGLLFFGPPGTGKTMLGKAFAHELKASFFSASGSEFVEMFVGMGAKRVRELWAEARKNSPSVIFIDEVDAVGGKRGDSIHRNKETEQTLNQILTEMDGMNDNTDILVIFATNRPDILDEALLRPGRIDHQIMIPLPDLEARKEIVQIHARNKPLSQDVQQRLNDIAENTYGYSGADLMALFKHAANHAIGMNQKEITMENIHYAIDRVLLGSASRSIQNSKDKERVAYHEAGHALITALLRPSSIRKATIVPRGQALGFVSQKPDETYLSTQIDYTNQLQIMVAGGLAESVKFGEYADGVSGDVEQAKKLIERMVDLGMGDDPFILSFEEKEKQTQMKKIYTNALQKSKELINSNLEKLEKIAIALIEKETLEGFEIEDIIK